MDDHSKREVLEIFDMNEKMLLLGHQLVNNLRFLAEWSRDVLRDTTGAVIAKTHPHFLNMRKIVVLLPAAHMIKSACSNSWFHAPRH